MYLYRWEEGLREYFLQQPGDSVRLCIADGYVLGEVYNRCRSSKDPVLSTEEASKDFFRAVIEGVFLKFFDNSELSLKNGKIRVTDISEWIGKREEGFRVELLPLCVFFAAVWAYDFKGEGINNENINSDDIGSDRDYRERRFPCAIRWGLKGRYREINASLKSNGVTSIKDGVINLYFEENNSHFSIGIIRLFEKLKEQIERFWEKKALYMPPEGFQYGISTADGITISHAIFRYGEIDRIYSNFGRHNLSVGQNYCKEDYERVAEACRFDEKWKKERCIKDDEHIDAIAKLFNAWDGDIDGEVFKSANVDWYLRIDGGCAEYIAGFDRFPKKGERWRNFDVVRDNNTVRKRFMSTLTWAEPLPWNQDVKIKYDGNSWHTLKPNGVENSGVDESCLFHSAEMSFGVFVRYRSNENDCRSNWWRRYDWNELPELGSIQKDFLICARDENVFQSLKLECESITLEASDIKCFTIQSHGDCESRKFPFRIYSVIERSKDKDTEIIVFNGDKEERRIKVRGKTPRIEVNSNEHGCFVSSMGRDSHCVSMTEEIALNVQFPRDGQEYLWTLDVDGKRKQIGNGNEVRVKLGANIGGNCIVPFVLCCVEKKSSKKIGCIKGVLLPDGVMTHLLSGNINNIGGNWKVANASELDTLCITDRIEGIRRLRVEDPEKENCEICVPDKEFMWWFEDGNNYYGSMSEPPALHSRKDFEVEKFDANSMRQKYLCLPPDIVPPNSEEWHFMSYWRMRIDRLVDTTNFRYNPQQEPASYGWCDKEFFKYMFEPSQVRLCTDFNGNLGVFVPANDSSEYKVWAFSDKTNKLLVSGKELCGTESGKRFTEVQAFWDGFCKDTEGYDAVLAVLKNDDNVKGIFSTFDKYDCQMLMSLVKRSQENNVVYSEEDLALYKMIRSVWTIPEKHPICEMHFYTTPQQETYDGAKKTWKEVVDVLLSDARCVDAQCWTSLFDRWLTSGFDPILEGVAQDIYEKIKQSFACRVELQDPFHTIDQRSEEWMRFMQRFLNARNLNGLRKEDIRRVAPEIKVTQNRIEILNGDIERHCNKWRDFDGAIKRCLGRYDVDVNLKNYIQGLLHNVYFDCAGVAREIVHRAQLNNNVNAVCEFFVAPGNDPVTICNTIVVGEHMQYSKNLYTKLLELLADRRMVHNQPSEIPTDREWLFFAAASVTLIRDGAEIPVEIRDVLWNILKNVRRDENEERWSQFLMYQRICNSIRSALEVG